MEVATGGTVVACPPFDAFWTGGGGRRRISGDNLLVRRPDRADDRRLSQRIPPRNDAHNVQYRRLRAGNERRPNLGRQTHVGRADNGHITNTAIDYGDRADDDRSTVARGKGGSDPVLAGDLSVKARHVTDYLLELLRIDCQRKPRLGRLLAAGQQPVALLGVEPEPMKLHREGRSCLPPGAEIGEKVFDPHVDFSRLRDDQHAVGDVVDRPRPPLSCQLLGATVLVTTSIIGWMSYPDDGTSR